MSDSYDTRLQRLDALLVQLERVAVAFSGGVDSSVLLHAAHRVLGDGAAAVIADSPSLPRRELSEARAVATAIGARLAVIATNELDDARYRENKGDRCYFCKSALFAVMEPWARDNGFRALAFGEIVDDLSDHRPGAVAAKEFGVVAPLSAAGFSKDDVRRYARENGLAVADKPSSACLASRLPVGTTVTREKLARIERAEEALRAHGLRQLRVRDHGRRARVEVGADEVDFARALALKLEAALADVGFEAVEWAVYRTALERSRAQDRS
ncbi:MAG: ATP-dependent sacrificial sulfur transferase LarE [Planctomycetes bacterium]|nr:ATP-dependent sacrificial sulfur transferase LarE [Planctomycetota bacterium]